MAMSNQIEKPDNACVAFPRLIGKGVRARASLGTSIEIADVFLIPDILGVHHCEPVKAGWQGARTTLRPTPSASECFSGARAQNAA